MQHRKLGFLVTLSLPVLLWTTSVAHCTAVGPGGGGDSLGSPNYPETVPPALSDADASFSPNPSYPFSGSASGLSMSTGGSLDFTTSSSFAAGGAITLSYSVDYLFSSPFIGEVLADMSVLGNGTFSVSNSNPTTEQITAFSVSGALYDQNGTPLDSTTLNLVTSPSPLPYDAGGSDDNAQGIYGSGLNIQGSTISSVFGIPSSVSSFDFRQTVSVTFSGIQPDETVYVNFPNGGSLTPLPLVAAPEPSSLTLLGIGTCVLMGYGWKRRKAVPQML